jgi:hypothetical protein
MVPEYFYLEILSFFYQLCNKVIFLKMSPFLQPKTHLKNGYSLACKSGTSEYPMYYVLSQIFLPVKVPKIINLNFRH